MVQTYDIFKAIESVAPRFLAENWDNVGLQIGSYKKEVHKVLVTLDVTDDVVKEGIEKGVDLIVSHHPFIFNGVKSICVDYNKGLLVSELIKHDITLYAAHTNMDSAQLGLNHYIAHELGVINEMPLSPSPCDQLYKLVVFTPQKYTEKILKVFGDNGAGCLGKYSHCSFRAVGKTTFKPLNGAKPFIGEKNKIETVVEDRIETIVTQDMLEELIPKLKEAHPYEEMAYDLYPMDSSVNANENGLGKIGFLEEPMTSKAFIERIKNTLDIGYVRTAGNPPKMVKKVALCTGSGADFIGLAKLKKADVYITGDLKYHEAQRAVENNLWVIDAGHFGTEKKVVFLLKDIIDQNFDQVETIISHEMKDFIQVV